MNPILARIFTVVIAFNFACLGAYAVIGAKLLLLIALSNPGESLGYILSVSFLLVILGAVFPPLISLAPSVIAIIAAENLAWRSWIYYAGVGALSGLIVLVAIKSERATDAHGGQLGVEDGLSLVAGITGGLIYWLFAGRSAGAARAHTRAGETGEKE